MRASQGEGHCRWLILAIVSAIMAALTLFDAVWRLANGQRWVFLSLPLALLFWYWIGRGAWRRSATSDRSHVR